MGLFSKLFAWVTGSTKAPTRETEAASLAQPPASASAACPAVEKAAGTSAAGSPIGGSPALAPAVDAPTVAPAAPRIESPVETEPVPASVAPTATVLEAPPLPALTTEPYPEALTEAARALAAGRYKDVLSLAMPYADAADARLQADANRYCAEACAQLGQWPQAFARWHALFELDASAAHAARLATASAMCGEVERGESWLSLAEKINAETRETPPAMMKWEFVGVLYRTGCYPPALKHLDWFKGLYERLSITDSAFLRSRGMPDFAEFLERSYAVLNRIRSTDEIRVWYRSMQSQLDAAGRQKLQDVFRRLA